MRKLIATTLMVLFMVAPAVAFETDFFSVWVPTNMIYNNDPDSASAVGPIHAQIWNGKYGFLLYQFEFSRILSPSMLNVDSKELIKMLIAGRVPGLWDKPLVLRKTRQLSARGITMTQNLYATASNDALLAIEIHVQKPYFWFCILAIDGPDGTPEQLALVDKILMSFKIKRQDQ